MKKIGIVSFKDPSQRAGGVEVVVYNIAKYLSKKYKIIVFCAASQNEIVETEFFTLVKVKAVQSFFMEFSYSFNLRGEVKKYDIDLLIDNGALSLLVKKVFKIVTIVHGTNAGNAISRKVNSISGFVNFIYRVFLWFIQNFFFVFKANKIIAISEKVKGELGKYYFFVGSKIETVSNATEIYFEEKPESIFSQKEKGTVLFVSTDHKWKGYSTLEKLAEIKQDYTFFICGSPTTSSLKNITYLGYLSAEGLKKVYLRYEFFIMPSQYEGQSLAMLDAIASGQILATEVNADPYIKSSGVHLIKNRDVDEYLKILNLSEEEKKRQSIDNVEIMKELNWKNQVEKYDKVIMNLL